MTTFARPDWSGRLAAVQAALEASRLEAAVVSQPHNLTYLTGIEASAGLLVLTPKERLLILDRRYTLAAEEEQAIGQVAAAEIVPVERRYDLTLAALVERLGTTRVGFEAAAVTVATLQSWQKAAPDAEWVPTSELVERQRLIKDAFEQAVFRRGGHIISRVAAELPKIVQKGRTEIEIARDIDAAIRRAGFSGPAFPTIVASGPNSARPHAQPGPRVLQPGDLVVLDFGGVLDGYCLDLTRMAGVGPMTDAAMTLFDAVLTANRAAVAAVRPGIDVSVIDQAARDVLEARGFGEAFSHSTGHGLGLDVHEAPRVGRADLERSVVAETGMIFTIEPGAYVQDLGGVRMEDDVLVTTTGYDVLTDASRELIVV